MLRAPVSTYRRGVIVALLSAVTLAACGGSDAGPAVASTIFEGGRLIVGDGQVIEDGVMVVEGDRLAYVGARSGAPAPDGSARVDLTGMTVMPGIVNAHAHLAVDRPGRAEMLQHMAYYGTSAVISLGLDEGDVGYQMRDEVVPMGARSLTAGRGITSPEPGRTEVPYWVTTPEEARAAVQELVPHEVDLVKIWVDDRDGQYERLSPELYAAVINEAHAHGFRVIAHIFRLEDAKGLMRAGIDAFAHSIRDMDVDDEMVQLWREHPDVVLIPNLPAPGVATDVSWLSGTIPPDQLARMQEGASRARPAAQEAFGIQARNLMRLQEAGVTIAFGTDGGSPWAVHEEMEDMVRTGMSPAAVIVAATSTSADFLRLDDLGTLAAGKSADFVVLDANPLEDITNSRRIADVYLRGERIDRAALAQKFLASAAAQE